MEQSGSSGQGCGESSSSIGLLDVDRGKLDSNNISGSGRQSHSTSSSNNTNNNNNNQNSTVHNTTRTSSDMISTTASATTTTISNTNTTLATTSSKPPSMELDLLNSLIDDVIFSECLQVHRAAKMGLIFTEPGDETYRIKDGVGLDVFGQPLSRKKQYNCICPCCNRNIAASRLAPHLEKCMGMGRLSARAASNKRDLT